MEVELVSVCYVVTTRSTAQKSVCKHVLALRYSKRSAVLAIQSDPLSRAPLTLDRD